MTICSFKVLMLYDFENPIKMSHHVSFSPRPDLPQYGHTLCCSQPIKTSYRYNTWQFWLKEIVINPLCWSKPIKTSYKYVEDLKLWQIDIVINPHFMLQPVYKRHHANNKYSLKDRMENLNTFMSCSQPIWTS